MKDYVTPGKAYLIYRYFPLPMARLLRPPERGVHVCAAAQLGKYRHASEVLFAKQSTWSLDGKVAETVDTVLTAPEQKKVRALLKDPAVQGQIAHDLAGGRSVLGPRDADRCSDIPKAVQYPLSGEGVQNYTLLKVFLDDLLKK